MTRVSAGSTLTCSPMAAASDRGSAGRPGARGSKPEPSLSSVRRYSGCPPVSACSRRTTASSSDPVPSAAASDATSFRPRPASGICSRFCTLDSIRRAASSRRSPGPRCVTTVITGSTDSRRSMNVSASTDLRSAHCRSSMKIATGPVAACSLTTSSSLAPTANDETSGPVPPAGTTSRETRPAARSTWSTSPKSRSASAWSARAGSTVRPGPSASARQRRARAVFPSPGSPSMVTSHGCPAFTLATTSATRASSAARPTKTPSGGCRSCTRPPRSRQRCQRPG